MMRLTLVTGGARSGKSSYAQAKATQIGGARVTYIATATPSDDEMALRISRHQAERPASWQTIERAADVGAAIAQADFDTVLLDCLTVLAGRVMHAAFEGGPEAAMKAVANETETLLSAARAREGTLLVVSNEVGMGVVPPTSIGRWYRDALGLANQEVARAAERVVFLVSGQPLLIKGRHFDER